ncbi:large subunit ribosomal protein LP2 [Nematocida minor]|uniref:large subunit ribosomal protein LP2 n=1 Tax=Nematocida minor TaxID=1912983 RepID=UPI00221F23EA|nr:large subunit ribosomal protein LP2 [Nematocida minor]XP_051332056.1 large subunit ribosomal protein LP2 [Nematocida minor]KAI5188786.1 large subunit ribosomal protein LP2 [Nematocida minor]KAI5188890.1 large subunit ribosomal protein LP2 [Nematocida minor]
MDCLLTYRLLECAKSKAPNAAEIEDFIKFLGGKSDSAKIQALLAAVEGKNSNELIAKGVSMLQSAAPAAASASSAAAPEAKKVEEEEESEEESSGDMDLFG